jgi:hypothetical protein
MEYYEAVPKCAVTVQTICGMSGRGASDWVMWRVRDELQLHVAATCKCASER